MFEFDLQFFAEGKTEQPTPKRRREARQRGHVAKSAEVTGAAVLLAVAVGLRLLGPHLYRELSGLMSHYFQLPVRELDQAALTALFVDTCWTLSKIATPVMLTALVTGCAANVSQVGFLFTARGLAPDLNRLNPLEGAKRIFSKRALFDLVKSAAKVAIIGGIAYFTLRARADEFPTLMVRPLGEVIAMVGQVVWALMMRAGLAIAGLAALDYWYQRNELERSLKMSKQEVKQELRETEGDPMLRSRIRSRQQQIARRRMMQAVKTADVVVTNPTEYAVALKYEPAKMSAPEVVAKGRGAIAAKIREIAAAHNVPIVPNPPLARALYAAADIGEYVSPELYQAVAEVLALVYRLTRRHL